MEQYFGTLGLDACSDLLRLSGFLLLPSLQWFGINWSKIWSLTTKL